MANVIKGEVPLKLGDGREFVMVMDMDAMVEAEAVYGKPTPQIMADASQGYIGATRALIYASLRARHPDITLKEASEIFMAGGPAAVEAMQQAFVASFGEAEPEDEGEGKKSPNPRMKNSGGRGVKLG